MVLILQFFSAHSKALFRFKSLKQGPKQTGNNLHFLQFTSTDNILLLLLFIILILPESISSYAASLGGILLHLSTFPLWKIT